MIDADDDRRARLALDLVNTWDPYLDQPELLREPGDLARFLAARGIPGGETVDDRALAEVRMFRDRLRAVVETEDAAAAAAGVNALLQRAEVTPRLTADGGEAWRVELTIGPGLAIVDRVIAEAALGLAGALARYGVGRLRVCAADPCREAFVDTSRNRSRRYCSDRCANRRNAAAFRRRRRDG